MKLSPSRLSTLRTAADVGIRLSPLRPHTVNVKADELGAMVDELRAMRNEIERIGPVYVAALAWHRAEHAFDSHCNAGDCDNCTKRPALAALAIACDAVEPKESV